jgi:hypothetical protein
MSGSLGSRRGATAARAVGGAARGPRVLTGGVQGVPHRVHDAGEAAEEDDEGDDAGVEQRLVGQVVRQLRGGGGRAMDGARGAVVRAGPRGGRGAARCLRTPTAGPPARFGGAPARPAGRGLLPMAHGEKKLQRARSDGAGDRAGQRRMLTAEYSTVKPMAMGRLTQVLRKGMISAPEPGAVTTSTSCAPRAPPSSGAAPAAPAATARRAGRRGRANGPTARARHRWEARKAPWCRAGWCS